jgi:hypothetical protein
MEHDGLVLPLELWRPRPHDPSSHVDLGCPGELRLVLAIERLGRTLVALFGGWCNKTDQLYEIK